MEAHQWVHEAEGPLNIEGRAKLLDQLGLEKLSLQFTRHGPNLERMRRLQDTAGLLQLFHSPGIAVLGDPATEILRLADVDDLPLCIPIEVDAWAGRTLSSHRLSELQVKTALDDPAFRGQLDSMVDPRSPVQQARDRTLRRLARRDLSEAEIRLDLRRNYTLKESDIRAVLTDLIRMGLVNDERLAQLLVRTLTEQGRGPRWIEMKLKKRGLSRPANSEAHNRESGRERASQWVRKRYPRLDQDPRERTRALAALARRGFSYSEATEILGVSRIQDEELTDH